MISCSSCQQPGDVWRVDKLKTNFRDCVVESKLGSLKSSLCGECLSNVYPGHTITTAGNYKYEYCAAHEFDCASRPARTKQMRSCPRHLRTFFNILPFVRQNNNLCMSCFNARLKFKRDRSPSPGLEPAPVTPLKPPPADVEAAFVTPSKQRDGASPCVARRDSFASLPVDGPSFSPAAKSRRTQELLDSLLEAASNTTQLSELLGGLLQHPAVMAANLELPSRESSTTAMALQQASSYLRRLESIHTTEALSRYNEIIVALSSPPSQQQSPALKSLLGISKAKAQECARARL